MSKPIRVGSAPDSKPVQGSIKRKHVAGKPPPKAASAIADVKKRKVAAEQPHKRSAKEDELEKARANGAKLSWRTQLKDTSTLKLSITSPDTAFSSCYINTKNSDGRVFQFMMPASRTIAPKHHIGGIGAWKGKGGDSSKASKSELKFTNGGDWTMGNLPRETPEDIARADITEPEQREFVKAFATFIINGPLEQLWLDFSEKGSAKNLSLVAKDHREKILHQAANDVALQLNLGKGDIDAGSAEVTKKCGDTGQDVKTHKHPELYAKWMEAVKRNFCNSTDLNIFYPRDADDEEHEDDYKAPAVPLRQLARMDVKDIPNLRMWLTRDAFYVARERGSKKKVVKPPVPASLKADSTPAEIMEKMLAAGFTYSHTRTVNGITGDVIEPSKRLTAKLITQNSLVMLGVRLKIQSTKLGGLKIKLELDPFLGIELLRIGSEDVKDKHVSGSAYAGQLSFDDFYGQESSEENSDDDDSNEADGHESQGETVTLDDDDNAEKQVDDDKKPDEIVDEEPANEGNDEAVASEGDDDGNDDDAVDND